MPNLQDVYQYCHEDKLIDQSLKVLQDFRIPITSDIVAEMERLRSNEIALERYMKGKIKSFLFKDEGESYYGK